MLFPTTCTDNFFSDPDRVVEKIKQFELIDFPKKTYPGFKTNNLLQLDKDFGEWILKKIIAVSFPSLTNSIGYKANLALHVIPKNWKHDGWVHNDTSKMTAIIYLSKDNPAGTSIYERKDLVPSTKDDINKYDYFRNPRLFTGEKEKKLISGRDEWNSNYNETIKIKGAYNRLVTFNGTTFHAAHSSFGKDRITLLAFFEQFEFNEVGLGFPLEMSNNI